MFIPLYWWLISPRPGFCSSVHFVSSSQTLLQSKIKLYYIWRCWTPRPLYHLHFRCGHFYSSIMYTVCLLCMVALVYCVAVVAPHFASLTWPCLFLLYIMSIWPFLFRSPDWGACSVHCHLVIGLLQVFEGRSSAAYHLIQNTATWPVFNFPKFLNITQWHSFLHRLPVASSFRYEALRHVKKRLAPNYPKACIKSSLHHVPFESLAHSVTHRPSKLKTNLL